MRGWPTPILVAVALTAVAGPAHADCAPDAALSRAAADLLLEDAAPSSQQLTAAVRAAGSEAVSVRALYLRARDPERVRTWLEAQRARGEPPLICGDARSARARLILASPRAATLRIEQHVVRAELAPGFDRPELVVRAADGQAVRLAVDRAELARGVPLDPTWRATRVQLTAWSASGPRPVAERDIGDPEQLAALHGAGPGLGLQGGAALDAPAVAAVIGELRERHRRHPLRRNRLADRVALGHARAVCADGRVVHSLEPGVDPQTRVERAGLQARLVGEVVARADAPGAALEALWHSPSHALTLLEPRFTDVGVGLATDASQRSCLVVLLLAWPRAIPVTVQSRASAQ